MTRLEPLLRIGLVVLLPVLMGRGPAAAAISITCTGSWTETIDRADLQGGPGSDLNSDYESSSGTGAIDITGTAGDFDTWRVDVRRTDASWDSRLSLYVRRTSDGTGTGPISGGTAYQAITATNASFFEGGGDHTNVTIQLRLSGMSYAIPAANYTTTVVLTVVDLP